ncbi:MAG: SUMF1/EgtB/PvdO family nonheme iron enzyme [Candidatus Margulisiibacteriota bacterium]
MAVEINGMRVASVAGRIVNLEPIRPAGISVMIPEMVRVAGGTFSMGSTRWSDTQPIRQVTLKDFAIGKYPVTNGEYLGHLQVMGLKIPELVANPEFAMHPVVNVSWHGAMEYCTFLNELKMPRTEADGFRKFSLPTEAQWEFAARGIEGREYPWGNESYEGRVNFNSRGTATVNAFPLGATPSGILGMSGNVWGWLGDRYASGYNPEDITNPLGPQKGDCRVVRGGSWYDYFADDLLAAFRVNYKPGVQCNDVGFRVAENLG